MKKFALASALALVLSGTAYAQGHDHGGAGAGFGARGGAAVSGSAHVGGGGSGATFNGGARLSGAGSGNHAMMSRSSSGASGFGNGRQITSSHNGTVGGPQFSRMDHGSRGRMVYDQEHGNRTLYNRYNDHDQGRENLSSDRGYERYGRERSYETFSRDRGQDMDMHSRGVVRGNFFEHGRRFGFRRFWHDEWVYLTDWDSCTAWAWLHVAPGVWAWRPIDVCVG